MISDFFVLVMLCGEERAACYAHHTFQSYQSVLPFSFIDLKAQNIWMQPPTAAPTAAQVTGSGLHQVFWSQ